MGVWPEQGDFPEFLQLMPLLVISGHLVPSLMVAPGKDLAETQLAARELMATDLGAVGPLQLASPPVTSGLVNLPLTP